MHSEETIDITKSVRKEASHIYEALGTTLERREEGVKANNDTHSHSASTYKFLVASLFSRPK